MNNEIYELSVNCVKVFCREILKTEPRVISNYRDFYYDYISRKFMEFYLNDIISSYPDLTMKKYSDYVHASVNVYLDTLCENN